MTDANRRTLVQRLREIATRADDAVLWVIGEGRTPGKLEFYLRLLNETYQPMRDAADVIAELDQLEANWPEQFAAMRAALKESKR